MSRTGRAALAVILAFAATLLGISPAQAADVGFVGPSYGTSTTAPTGQKPQSKLWVTDGIWWGALFDKTSGDFHIFRFNSGANTWTDTGVLIDDRTNMYMDSLWDGQHLYVLSAGTSSSNTAHKPRVMRFSYAPASQTWTMDAGFPVTPLGNGGVKSPVLDIDSDGVLWATFFSGSKIWVSHSLLGDDKTWVAPYQLPTPNGESSVGSDDLSALVAFDGDKVGVLWSNQLPASETVYWAWHQDGTSDQQWTTQVAYRQPEGADDHISLKSLVGDASGRVFAVAKTSMDNASDPLFNLLTLNLAGQWSATQVWNQADDSTRAIVQIDSQNRQVYVFAAAPCCSGGTIYYKKAALDNPTFAAGLGTPFIHSDAHPEANNPTSTKQLVNSSTDLVVMASDDETRTYLYNRLDLGSSSGDTTPPQTTITDAPSGTTTSTSATFAFSSNETSSTFACTLDTGPTEQCTSPHTYTGLDVGTHTFSVVATDAAGNVDSTPATASWTVQAEADTTAPDTTIDDGPSGTTTSTTATFTFSSNETGSTFACTLDSAAAESCTSPKTYSGLAVGAHTFSVTATDAAGNDDSTPATASWTVEADTTAPDTTVTSGPDDPTTSSSATFEFISSEPGSTFACTLDDGAAQPCTSPKTYSGLALGGHTFTVAATDGSGNTDGTAATRSWTVEVATLLTDDFSSGGFTAGGWSVTASKGGTATVITDAVHAGDLGARLVSTTTSGSASSIRKNFAAQPTLTAHWDVKVTAANSTQSFALAKVYSSSGRVFSLMRNGSNGALSIQDTSSTTSIGTSLPLNQVRRISVTLAQGATADTIRISIDGVQVFSSTTRNLGTANFTGLRLSDDSKRRAFDYRVDNVQVTS